MHRHPAAITVAPEPYTDEGPRWVVAMFEPPVGGVGVRALRPGLGEIRRLWVALEAGGQGVARTLMDAALALGLTALRLGTGDRQPEAAALDESSGWEPVHEGRAGRPVPARHIWFTKLLTRAT